MNHRHHEFREFLMLSPTPTFSMKVYRQPQPGVLVFPFSLVLLLVVNVLLLIVLLLLIIVLLILVIVLLLLVLIVLVLLPHLGPIDVIEAGFPFLVAHIQNLLHRLPFHLTPPKSPTTLPPPTGAVVRLGREPPHDPPGEGKLRRQ